MDYLCDRYREFLSAPENMKYTFRFIRLDQLSGYGKITSIESQTYEDPMILAMSLHTSKDASRDYLAKKFKFSDRQIEAIYTKYRPSGPVPHTSGTRSESSAATISKKCSHLWR